MKLEELRTPHLKRVTTMKYSRHCLQAFHTGSYPRRHVHECRIVGRDCSQQVASKVQAMQSRLTTIPNRMVGARVRRAKILSLIPPPLARRSNLTLDFDFAA